MVSAVCVADPRQIPRYSIPETARIAGIAPSTLRSWVLGRPYPTQQGAAHSEPLIPSSEAGLLSFEQLVEAHILRALRTRRGIPLQHVRAAIAYAEESLGITRLLVSPELKTGGERLLLDRFGKLLDLSQSGQYAIRAAFQAHLQRIEWESNVAVRLFPFLGEDGVTGKLIAIDPRISFGRPVLLSRSIPTAIIVLRMDQGEQPEALAEDYGVTLAEITEAAVYENRLAA